MAIVWQDVVCGGHPVATFWRACGRLVVCGLPIAALAGIALRAPVCDVFLPLWVDCCVCVCVAGLWCVPLVLHPVAMGHPRFAVVPLCVPPRFFGTPWPTTGSHGGPWRVHGAVWFLLGLFGAFLQFVGRCGPLWLHSGVFWCWLRSLGCVRPFAANHWGWPACFCIHWCFFARVGSRSGFGLGRFGTFGVWWHSVCRLLPLLVTSVHPPGVLRYMLCCCVYTSLFYLPLLVSVGSRLVHPWSCLVWLGVGLVTPGPAWLHLAHQGLPLVLWS